MNSRERFCGAMDYAPRDRAPFQEFPWPTWPETQERWAREAGYDPERTDFGCDRWVVEYSWFMPYRDYKKRYGHRVCLHGNIDLVWPLSQGTPADVERNVIEHMEVLKPGGHWIAGSSHSIVNSIPHENFLAMINAFHKYGIY